MKTLSPGPGVLVGYLRRIPLFQGLDERQLEGVAARAFLRLYDRGDVLLREGEVPRELVWVAHGAARVVRRTPDGREKVIHLLPAPTLVAEAPTLLGEPVPASAICNDSSTVVAIDRAALVALLGQEPEIGMRVLGATMLRLRELTRSLAAHGQSGAAGRVASYLLGLSQGRPEVALPAAKKDVANYLGLQPESFSRALAVLKQRGAIEVGDKDIVITDRAALEACLAEGSGAA